MKPRYPTCLSTVAVLLTACATHTPVIISNGLTLPPDLVKLTCGRFHPVKDANWDGAAWLIWSSATHASGVGCSYTSTETGLQTIQLNVDIRTPLARELRAFLAAHGVTVPAEDDKPAASAATAADR